MKLFKNVSIFLLILVALAGAFWLGARSGHGHSEASASKSEQLYTCGMHPQVIQNKPGNCSICGMKLTPMRKQPGNGSAGASGERQIKYYKSTMMPGEISQTPGNDSMGMEMVPVYEDAAAESSTIAIDPVTIQNMAIRTDQLTKGPLRRTIRTVGVIDFDETGLAQVTTKFMGWIEKLYVDATGSQVHRGERLFEIYSPELYSAQVEYLLALRQGANTGSGAEALKESTRLKLKYWDISDEQITELENNGKPQKTLQVSAPIDGFVVEKMIVEGQMVNAGKTLYQLANLSLVWVQTEVYEKDLPYLKLGQEAVVTLSYLPDRKFRGRVTYIYPTVDEKTRTAKVRMEFHNPGFFLKPGMFATVELRSQLEPMTLLVPDSAVLRSGEKNTVFVALEGGRFDPRTVVLGPRGENDMHQVLDGLNEGEKVVVSGQFMLDSESQLREAIRKMLEPSAPDSVAHAGHAMEASHAAEEADLETSATAAAAGPHVYICPMPEHVAIEYDHPGKCPLCDMTLVPVSEQLLAKIQPGGTLEYYTCPMPEHSDVRLSKPGKCPQCAMTLIPFMKSNPVPAATAAQPPEAMSVTLYTCPMDVHADVVSDKPGKCPKCEMQLVETSKVKHGKIAEEHWRKAHPAVESPGAEGADTETAAPPLLYTCPMDVHADVVSDKPGKCPKCEMPLVETGKVKHGKTSEEHWRKQHPASEERQGVSSEHQHEH